ncbi:MAG: hypothetical protein K8F91_19900 [Candidatus Obscuribacterales bacterium]|nr:hypothetical protein [Candidatus Obscuribacterales bacterium]
MRCKYPALLVGALFVAQIPFAPLLAPACLGQESQSQDSDSTSQSADKQVSTLDEQDMFGDVNFVKGVSADAVAKNEDQEETADEIVGSVVVTTNPFTSIPKPNGIMVGIVFEPSKDGKPVNNAGPSPNMLTGIGAILNAMSASNSGKSGK